MTTTPEAIARRMHQALEAYHGMIYFVSEGAAEYESLGMPPGMMGYFASRSAAMGAVTADTVIATFYNFHPAIVRAAIPAAWSIAEPSAVLDARRRAVDASLRRMLGDRLDHDDVADAAALARRAAEACRPEGRPLHAGHAGLAWPESAHLQLWHAVTLLREHRGDGHIAALVAEGVTGCEALVMHAAASNGTLPAKVLRRTRQWSDDEWAATEAALVDRGWLDTAGEITHDGRSHRQRVEDQTDAMAAAPWRMLNTDELGRLAALGRELSATIVDAGTFRRLPG